MEQTKIISVEAVQTIQDLRNNIKLLKGEIDTLTVGSAQYNEKVQELATNQRALKLAMTGVYESMRDVAEASRQDVAALDATIAAAKEGTATYNQMSTALGVLKAQIKDVPKYLNAEAQALGQINPAYTELSNKVQLLDGSLKSLDADNGVFSRNVGNYVGALQEWGGTMGMVAQVGQGLSVGIMSVVAALSVFGVDTEETKESLQAIVPIFGILQGAKGLGGLVKLLPKAAAGEKAVQAATAGATVATKANTAALGQQTVAEEAATTAGITLKGVLDSLGIGLIITAVAALAAGIAVLVKNTNKSATETKKLEKAYEDLDAEQEERNRKLSLEQRILEAQGATKEQLLQQQKDEIIRQKEQTKALLATTKQRLNLMNADSGWVKFWKGENKQIKNLEELVGNLEEKIKGFDDSLDSINTDIRVNRINKANDAAKKTAETFENDVKNAVQIADGELKNFSNELDNINSAYEQNKKTLETQLATVKERIKTTKNEKELVELLETQTRLEAGLSALEENTNKLRGEYFKKQYEKQLAVDLKEIEYTTYNTNGLIKDKEKFMRNVLGYTEKEIFAAGSAETVYGKIIDDLEEAGSYIENDLAKSGVTVGVEFSGLSWDTLVKMSQTDYDKLAKNVGEPIATAINAWFKNKLNISDALINEAEATFVVMEQKINEAIEKRDYLGAQSMLETFAEHFKEFYPDLVDMADSYFEQLQNKIATTAFDDEFFAKLRNKITIGISAVTLNGFDAVVRAFDGFNKGFVDSTANALSEIGDLWEQSLKLRYKQLVEDKKLTEEQADNMAKEAFKKVKALQYTVAGINTAAAIVQALADPTVPSYYVKAANAVAAAAAGAAQIMQISMSEFGKPSINVDSQLPSYTPAPNQTIYTYGINPMDYAEAQSQNPVRAYVVDKDLSDGLNNYNNRQNETTF